MAGRRRTGRTAFAVGVAAAGLLAAGGATASAQTTTRTISAAGTTHFSPHGTLKGIKFPVWRGEAEAREEAEAETDRELDRRGFPGAVPVTPRARANPELRQSFDGLRGIDQTFANNGNQFSVEPPDQGLCVGNGFVLESVNTVLRAHTTDGTPASGTVDLNSFYGYPAQIDRGVDPPTIGPFTTDPSCLFDEDTQRWFHVILTLDVDPGTGDFLGPNHLDLAVSKTADPTGEWTIYRIPAQDDGTQGTPNHQCAPSDVPLDFTPTNPNACIGDYPHIGADANGFYITTNEYPLFPSTGFHAAQVYAMSKRALAEGSPTLRLVQLDTVGADDGNPGFTIWPAISPPGSASSAAGGTEFFLSNNAAEEANGTGASRDLLVWALTGTSSLDSATPALQLSDRKLKVGPYAVPSPVPQKDGPTPLVDCVNDRRLRSEFFEGRGCWRFFFDEQPTARARLQPVDALDSRMQQVVYAAGHLWGSHGTALRPGENREAGVAWYDVVPSTGGGRLAAALAQSGYLALRHASLLMPAVGVLADGRGAMGFTVVGEDDYPSAGYAMLGPDGVGPVHVAKAGLGPEDGFAGLEAFGSDRPRWGDYGAAVMDGDSIWVANEYIGQRCTLPQYLTNTPESPLFTCGLTRDALINWHTRISRVQP